MNDKMIRRCTANLLKLPCRAEKEAMKMWYLFHHYLSNEVEKNQNNKLIILISIDLCNFSQFHLPPYLDSVWFPISLPKTSLSYTHVFHKWFPKLSHLFDQLLNNQFIRNFSSKIYKSFYPLHESEFFILSTTII